MLALTVLAVVISPQESPRVIQTLGLSPWERFGERLAAAGDVDGDGIPDFVATAQVDSTSAPSGGAVRWVSGATFQVIQSAYGAQAQGFFGTSVATVGDLDGDGVSDIVVGAVRERSAGVETGRAHLISSATGATIDVLAGPGALSRFGGGVAAPGDLDGDGVGEILVGAAGFDAPGGSDHGQVHLYSGATRTLIRDWTGQDGDQLGWRLAGVGDLDGDGRSEIAIASLTGAGLSRVQIFTGSTGALLRTHTAGPGQLGFGNVMLAVADHDADGTTDYLIAATSDNTVAQNAGRVTLYSGSTGAILREYYGSGVDEVFGSALAEIVDMDGDQRADFLIGSPNDSTSGKFAGAARIVSSATGIVLFERAIGIEYDSFGRSVVVLGDANGDGTQDFIVGSPGDDDAGPSAGSAFGFISVAPLGSSSCASTANSTGALAETIAVGSEVVAHGFLELRSSAVPPGALGIYLASTAPGFVVQPGGSQGNLCLGGAIGRYSAPGQIRVADATGAFALDLDLDAIPQPMGSVAATAGSTWHWQAWFRDAISGTPTSNFSSAVSVDLR